jgi:hypothetical protein
MFAGEVVTTMNRRVVWRGLVTSMTAVALASALGCSGGSAAASDAGQVCMPVDAPATCPSPPPSYKGEIQYVVANYCAQSTCHAPGGAVSVHSFENYEGVYGDHLTFAVQLSMCLMPPAGYPQPTPAQRLDLITWASTCKAPDN